MKITYNNLISRVQNTLNSQNKDQYIPKRYILAILKSKIEFLLAQKFNDKSLFRETNLYRWINCIEMEEIDRVKCGKTELMLCDTIMKSRKKLPKLIWSRYGSSVVMVTNIDNSKQYQIISNSAYVSMRKNRNFEMFKGNYAIIYPDNTLYIPDSTVKKVNVLLYTLDESTCDLDGNCDENNKSCKCYYDYEFDLPDKIGEVVIGEVLKEVSMRLQIPRDENPNLDSNIKTREV